MLLTGCGRSSPPAAGPVAVTPAIVLLSDDGAALCRRLVAALPATVGDRLRRRPVRDADLTAAWGEPPVTLACGVAEAPALDEQVQLGPPEGGLVTLAVDDVGAATAYTTVGLRVPVAVTVPDRYDATLLVPLTSVLLREDR